MNWLQVLFHLQFFVVRLSELLKAIEQQKIGRCIWCFYGALTHVICWPLIFWISPLLHSWVWECVSRLNKNRVSPMWERILFDLLWELKVKITTRRIFVFWPCLIIFFNQLWFNITNHVNLRSIQKGGKQIKWGTRFKYS